LTTHAQGVDLCAFEIGLQLASDLEILRTAVRP